MSYPFWSIMQSGQLLEEEEHARSFSGAPRAEVTVELEHHTFQDVAEAASSLVLLADAPIANWLIFGAPDEGRGLHDEFWRLLSSKQGIGLPWALPFGGKVLVLYPGESLELYPYFEFAETRGLDPDIAWASLNSWLSTFSGFAASWLRWRDAALYADLSGGARLERADHRSPFLITLSVALGVSVAATGALVWAASKVGSRIREDHQIAEIRTAQARQADADARTAEAKARVAEAVADQTERLLSEGQSVSRELLSNAALFQSPAIEGLARSPAVGSVTVGISAGKD